MLRTSLYIQNMNASNPFQLPSCLQRADSQQRRRERFKRGFIAVVAAAVVLLVGLLIEGCKTEQASNASAITPLGDVPPQASQPVTAEQKSNPGPQSNLATSSKPAPIVSTQTAPAAGQSDPFYVVKSGDTLTRIAKAHGTTVEALKAVNRLQSDRIVVGTRLKIPTT